MRFEYRTKLTIVLITLCAAIGIVLAQFAIAQAPGMQAGRGGMSGQPGGGGMGFAADPRAKTLTYRFKEADEDMQYCLFVSSKVSKDKKSPLIITLHGLGAGPQIMLGKQAVDLAEAGGYILVGPTGYNTSSWYGSMPGGMGGMMGGGRGGSVSNPGAKTPAGGGMMQAAAGAPAGGGSLGGFGGMMGGGATSGGTGANAEFTAKRQKSDKPSTGAAGKWLIKDSENEIKLELKVEGSKLTGTYENPQIPGIIEIKDGKIEGDKISFNYTRQMTGQDMKISWTGTLSGDEIKLKRDAAGGAPGGGAMGMPGMGGGGRGGGGMGSMFGGGNSSGKDTNALSEKDVMNVLDIICKEYNVDERRIYLMGHSMGGAGTLYLGTKYPDKFAALAAVAPAAFSLNPNILMSIKDKNVPVIVVRGDQDNIIGANVVQPWVDKLKELGMTYDFKLIPGVEHGGIINACLPSVYEFFGKYSKK
jgi:predicted esterase